MKSVIIIGGGFAGLSALGRLKGNAGSLEITLIDSKDKFNFLPLLPDAIGREITAEYLTNGLFGFCNGRGVRFVHELVTGLDLVKKSVFTGTQELNYDYLIIASGSETNFYGNEAIRKIAYKLDNAVDAEAIHSSVVNNSYDSIVIAGGGYTGIETATNLRLLLNKRNKSARVVIVERAPSILGPLPQWMKDYVLGNLKELKIECLTGSSIDRVEEGKIFLQGGSVFDNAMLIWAAGVKTSGYLQTVQAEKNPQGRLKVDEYLRLNQHCFVVGDAAYAAYKNNFLRMAIQFAITQGELAAENILNSMRGHPLKKYRPIDLGYIVPMANNKSCGIILGGTVEGFLGILLHYFMCIYRSVTFKNRWGIIRDLFAQ